jgi:hypothetical protein
LLYVSDAPSSLTDTLFSNLTLERPSPALFLDSDSASFVNCDFSNIRGPGTCGTIYSVRGSLRVELTSFVGTWKEERESEICVEDSAATQMLSDSFLEVMHLDTGEMRAAKVLREGTVDEDVFLTATWGPFIGLVKVRLNPRNHIVIGRAYNVETILF